MSSVRNHTSFTLLFLFGLSSAGMATQSLAVVGDEESSGFLTNRVTTIEPSMTSHGFKIDGVMEDDWTAAPRMENFTEIWPSENVPPKALTEAYVSYDAENLYLFFICYDQDIRLLRATMTDRDKIFKDDFVGIQLDTYGNEQAAYELFVNPFGIQGDLIRRIDGQEDPSFDAVWYSEARVYPDRWTAEVKVPFKSLRFPGTPEQDWRLHVLRIYPRDSRYIISWMPVSQNNNAHFSQAGHLAIRSQISNHSNVELLPYVLGNQVRSMKETDDENGRRIPAKWNGDAGFNLKYGLASNMTLDFAYNPDFSQIESDAGQISVNNTFALYYPEKRPFFLEGGDIFQVDNSLNLIYTRSLNDPLLAAKVTGKIGKATIGYVSAYDESTPFILPFEDGSSEFRTGKNSISNFARIKYDLGSRSYVGLAVTDRRISGGSGNTVAAADANIRLNEIYSITGLLGITRTHEPSDSVLSADEIDEGTFRSRGRTYSNAFDGQWFSGTVFRSNFQRNARHWNLSAVYEDVSPGLRAENSFIRSNNYRMANLWTGYMLRFDKHPVLTELEPSVFSWRKYNYDGTLKDWGLSPGVWIYFQKQTSLFLSVFVINNENFRGRQFNNMHRARMEVNSNAVQKVSGGFFVEVGKSINRRGEEGDPRNPLAIAKSLSWQVWATLKPFSRLADEFSYLSFGLWDHFGGSVMSHQNILRNTLSYQFTRRLFFRLVTQLNGRERYFTDTDGPVSVIVHERTRNFSIEPLVSYKVNPFTVFFLGGSIGGGKDPYPNYDGYTVTDQNIFVKFQYFVRI